uniref:Uncharacterized protein n=1 Tax=Oryza nivara TaxID=4536 RepID=A0A0E0IUF8_ORYNI
MGFRWWLATVEGQPGCGSMRRTQRWPRVAGRWEEVAGARRERRAASHRWPQPSAEAAGAATEEKGGCRRRCFDTRWLFPGYNWLRPRPR